MLLLWNKRARRAKLFNNTVEERLTTKDEMNHGAKTMFGVALLWLSATISATIPESASLSKMLRMWKRSCERSLIENIT
jgi:hypothetical protein